MLLEGLLIGQLLFHPTDLESTSQWRCITWRGRGEKGWGLVGVAEVAAQLLRESLRRGCEGAGIPSSFIKAIYQGVIFWGARGCQRFTPAIRSGVSRACILRRSDAEDASSRNIAF